MINVVTICGPSFKAPTKAELSGYLLDKMAEVMKFELSNHQKEWTIKDCTIMTDGWIDRGGGHSSIFLFPMEVIDHSTFLHAL